MEAMDHIAALQREGNLLAAAADEVGTFSPVPTCPNWTIGDLLWHTGSMHRWAKTIVTQNRQSEPSPDEFSQIAGPVPDRALLVEWYRESNLQLVRALSESPADLNCWRFLKDGTPLEFWARRQAHEAAIHRVDAESARGDEISPVGTAFAADGIDELINGFHSQRHSTVRSITPKVLRLHATDEQDPPADWYLHISGDPLVVSRIHRRPVNCTLSGPTELVYLALWNRCRVEDLDVTGDADVIKLWHELSPIVFRQQQPLSND